MSIYMILRERKQRADLAEKIKDFSKTTDAIFEREKQDLPTKPLSRYFIGMIRYLGNVVKPKETKEISTLQKKFLKAGIRSRNVIITFFGAKVICAACLSMGFAFVVFFSLHISALQAVTLLLVVCLIGFYLPNLWLSLKTSRRQDEFLRAFPDALDLLAVCVEAGMGIDAAIKRVGDEMRLSNKVLNDEFNLLNLEIRAGKERKEAMRSMADRIDLEDVSSWVAMLIQTDKFGTSIAQALRIHSDSLRIKRSQRVEEMAAKLPVKLLFPTILFIFPALFLVMLGPAVIRILKLLSQ